MSISLNPTKIMKKIKKVQFFAEKSEKKPTFAARKSKRELSSVGSEHRPYKAGVVGSSPTVPTKYQDNPLKIIGFFFFFSFYPLFYPLKLPKMLIL